MIVMLDTPTPLDQCAAELGGLEVEQLFTPLTRYTPQRPEQNFAIDNGSYSRFNANGFRSLLKREEPRMSLCRFVAVPDVIAGPPFRKGDARRTREVFDVWVDELDGWPLAYVCQDGQHDIPIPWKQIAAVFIGGSDDFKLGVSAVHCIKAALALGKWVHVGRVNTPDRFQYFEELGVSSIDGSGLARYTHMREKIHAATLIPDLFKEPALCADLPNF
jgi:hypothetical protein